MTSATCLTCASAALRDPVDQDRDKHLRRMAALGCINCTRSDFRATFHQPSHTCPQWAEAPPQILKARLAWAAKRPTTQGEPR